MSKPALSVYFPQSDSPSRKLRDDRREREFDRLAGTAEAKSVTVSLATIVPLLLHAAEHNRAWLQDFADDLVRIDADLYDVLLAYQQLQQHAVA